MKNEIYTFSLNDRIKFELAKYFLKNIKRTDVIKIEEIASRVEIGVCKYLDQIFYELKQKNTDLEFKMFKKELNKFLK